MRFIGRCSFFVVLSLTYLVVTPARVVGKDPSDVGIFVQATDQVGKQFAEIVSAGEAGLTTSIYLSLEELADSDADVLLIAIARSRQPFSDELIDAVKRKKVIGIGYGAAQLFGKLGLEINGGACAHFGSNSKLQLKLQDSRLLGNRSDSAEIAPYVQSIPADNFAMYLPKNSDRAYVLDPIARLGLDSNYAPLVRQNNFVLVGLSAVPQSWSPEYQELFRDIVTTLRKEKQKPFSKVKFPVAKPGKYAIALGHGRSTEQLPGKTYYFHFKQPTKFTATLQHNGSNSVMMLFMGRKNKLHWTRKDAKLGEPLTIEVKITADDLKQIGDNYWTLDITNFDRANSADCVVDVQYDEPDH